MVSHDLRAPLRAIVGFSHILARDHGERLEPECVQLLGKVQAAGKTTVALLEALARLAHVQRGDLQRETVDLARWLRRSWRRFRGRRRNGG